MEHKPAPNSRKGDDLEALSFGVIPGKEVCGPERLDIHGPTAGQAKSNSPSRKILNCSFYDPEMTVKALFYFIRIWDHVNDKQSKPGRILECIEKRSSRSSIIEGCIFTDGQQV